MAVVKNVAFPAKYAKALKEQVDYFGVSEMARAMLLRENKIKTPILVLYPTEVTDVVQAAENEIDLVAPSSNWVNKAAKLLKKAAAQRKPEDKPLPPLKVHLWVDTGIGRQGLLSEDILNLASLINHKKSKVSNYIKIAGVATHFCCLEYYNAEGSEEDFPLSSLKFYESFVKDATDLNNIIDNVEETQIQLHKFSSVVKKLKKLHLIPEDALVHAGASGVVQHKLVDAYFDMVRLGRILVDGKTSSHVSVYKFPEARQACETTLSVIKKLPKDWCVGYGCEQLEIVPQVGRLSHKTWVGYISGHCVEGIFPSSPLKVAFKCPIEGEMKEVPVLLNHGTAGILVDLSGHKMISYKTPFYVQTTVTD